MMATGMRRIGKHKIDSSVACPRLARNQAAAAVAPRHAVRCASTGRPPTGRAVFSSGSGRLFQPFCIAATVHCLPAAAAVYVHCLLDAALGNSDAAAISTHSVCPSAFLLANLKIAKGLEASLLFNATET